MRHRFLLFMLLASPFAALGACDGDVTDPDGLLESAEAEAVMRSAEALPLLPAFLEPGGDLSAADRAMLVRAGELWDAGTAADDPRASSRRRLALGYALPVLLKSVPESDWGEARLLLEEWTVTASAMLRHLDLPTVEARVRAAGGHLARADAAAGDRARVHHLLLAGSELVETTPRYVARTRVREAEAAVASATAVAGGARTPTHLKRAQRLKDWSARAVEEGEYLLAIQRAYYAIQLVEER